MKHGLAGLGLGLAIGVCLAGCDPLPAEDLSIAAVDKTELLRLLDAAKVKADGYSSARTEGLRKAWKELEPQTGSAPCPEKLPALPPLPGDDQTPSPADEAAFAVARDRMNVVPAWAVLGEASPEPLKPMQQIEAKMTTGGPRRLQYDRQSEMLRRLATEGKYTSVLRRDEALEMARKLGSDEFWGVELDVVAGVYKRGSRNASDTFESGLIVGKALLWSFKEGRVICAAAVTASNQDQIKLRVNPNNTLQQGHHTLDEDLKNEAYRAAITGLRVTAPGT